MSQAGFIFRSGLEADCVLVDDLHGRELVGRIDEERAIAELSAIDLREDAFVFDHQAFEKAESHYATALPFNEVTLAPRHLTSHPERAELLLGRSRYSAFCAARDQYRSLELLERIRFAGRERLRAPSAVSHTLGVNLTLETADGNLLITLRERKAGVAADVWNVSVSEGANEGDLEGDHYRPDVTARRGLREELGVDADEITSLSMHSLVTQLSDGNLSVLGHATTDLSAADVVRRHAKALDGNEAEDLMFFAFSPTGVAQLLDRSDHRWTQWALATIIGSTRARFGDEATASLYEKWATPLHSTGATRTSA